MHTERSNLLAFSRLVIQDVLRKTPGSQTIVIDESTDGVRTTEPLVTSVYRLLLIIEHCLCHGLRSSPCTVDPSSATDFWTSVRRAKAQVLSKAAALLPSVAQPDPSSIITHLERCLSPAPSELVESAMPGITTGLGRLRVWIRHALMQKRLGTCIKHLATRNCQPPNCGATPVGLSNGHLPHDSDHFDHAVFYDPEALLMNDEGTELARLLADISPIDFCFIMKENLRSLDGELPVIPYYTYLEQSDEKPPEPSSEVNSAPDPDLSAVIEQKNFLEDLNNKLQHRLDVVTLSQRAQEERVKALTTSLEELTLENRGLRISLTELKKSSWRSSIIANNTMSPCSTAASTDCCSPVDSVSGSVELQQLRTQNESLSNQLASVREELSHSQSSVLKLNQQITHLTTLVSQKQQLIGQLETKVRGANRVVEQIQERTSALDTEKLSAERTVLQLRAELGALQSRLANQHAELLIQSELASRLQRTLDDREVELSELKSKAIEWDKCRSQMAEMNKELHELRTLCREQETSLAEMATVVSSSKLEADSLRESHEALKDAQWADDSASANCSQCGLPFTMSRRRHHCRACGMLFCYQCSSQTMPLPSSAKPVRVCDGCHGLLLGRYVVKS